MKGGKGGKGRKRLPAKPVTKEAPREGPKRGAPKRDWGAVDRDEPLPPTTPKPAR
ncbi:MAG: hypothetical protein RL409_765 [Gemmatimonadota bacterium]|jgi:hypothetical protein